MLRWHVAIVWPGLKFDHEQHATRRNKVAKRSQHVVPNNAGCDMLRWHVAIVWPGFKKTTTATATVTSLNERLNKQNNGCTRYIFLTDHWVSALLVQCYKDT